MSVLAELKDRRLFQIVASYLAAGWIALEVVNQFVERAVVAEVVYDLVLLGYLCGIPAALVVGWYHGEKGAQRAPRSEVAVLCSVGVVFLALGSMRVLEYRDQRMAIAAAEREAGLDLRRIGVLYLTDHTPGSPHQHVADGLTEALIDELARVPRLEVTSRNAAEHFRGADLPRDSIASALEVGTLVDGTVEERGGDLRVTLRLFEGHSGSEFRSTSLTASPEELVEARDQVVEEAARLLRRWLGEEVRVRARGRRLTSSEGWTLFQRAEKARRDAEMRAGEHDVDGAFDAFARADSLLSQAALLAPDWADPLVLQARTAYRRSRLAHDRSEVLGWVDRGLEHANRALALESNHAGALDVRGTLAYWKYLNLQDSRPEEADRLLADARRDLEESVRIDPTLASAYSVLSHLLTREDLSSAVLAARRSYEADAYLETAHDVLLRLVHGNYDLENFDQMERWCEEGARRFPKSFRFLDCRLLLLTTRESEPDVEFAWELHSELESRSPENRRAYDRVRGLILVGGVIARASRTSRDQPILRDSARSVLARAREELPRADPRQELLPLAAHMYNLMDDRQTAIRLLRRYAAVNPGSSFEHHWRWRDLRGLPEFQPLLAGH